MNLKSVFRVLPYYYIFHADGQAVDPSRWFQNDPYEIVLKQRSESSDWEILDIDYCLLPMIRTGDYMVELPLMPRVRSPCF
jgi:hypothetical protein